MSKSRSLTQNSNVAGKRKIILDRQTREKERKEKPIAMGLSFGCTLESPEGIYKFLCPGRNTKPSKSLSLEGRKRVVLVKAPQLLPMCTPKRSLHYMGRVYYRKTELISVSFSPHVGISKRDELVLFPKLRQLKATWADSAFPLTKWLKCTRIVLF